MEQFVSVSSGITLHCVEQGDSAGVTVVFLHGVTDSWRSFEPVLPELPTTVHAFALSQRGHGDSSKPEGGYRYSDMSEDLRAFMDAKGIQEAVVVGHSMGSSVAQRFAIDHPSRVRGLVLMGAFATLFRDAGLTEWVRSAVLPLRDPVQPTFAREFQESTLARPVPPELLETVVLESLKVPARVWQATFRGFLETPDFSRELEKVVAPALIVWGDRDTYAVRAQQDRLLAVLPNARHLTYEGAGHGFHWEDPARFARDLEQFVAESAA